MVIIEQELQLVFGGHPAITPMIRLQVAQAGIPVGDRIVMFQSRYFERDFPTDNSAFEHVELVDSVSNDRGASLFRMRREMLAGPFQVGLFIGGMEGVEEEYALFLELQPNLPAFPIASTGAAAAKIFNSSLNLQRRHPELRDELTRLGDREQSESYFISVCGRKTGRRRFDTRRSLESPNNAWGASYFRRDLQVQRSTMVRI